MKTNQKNFTIEDSKSRVDDILSESDTSFEELNEIPAPEKLTFKNGFYINCSSLFVDIRRSKQLTNKYKRPTLAKIYRCFISEMVAICADSYLCRETNIQGDCVWAVFNTPSKYNIDEVFSVASKINSIRKLINKRFQKNNIDPIDIGIGLSYGRALMIKAGYYGSGINDIVYMGDVVNEASHMCSQADTNNYKDGICVSDCFYGNLNSHNQGLLNQSYDPQTFSKVYKGNVIWDDFDKYIDKNC